ncbi:MAG: endolytic transglycosylase MltG [Patescibacteria group bacterium]
MKLRRNKPRWLLYLILAVFIVGSFFMFQGMRPLKGRDAPLTFTVAPGQNFIELGKALEKAGAVRNSFAFSFYSFISGLRSKFQAGTYVIPENAGVAAIARLFAQGEGKPERTVTIIEGWTAEEIEAYLAKEKVFAKGIFLAAVKKIPASCPFSENVCSLVVSIPKKLNALEGYLFPDTYRLYFDAKPEDLIEKMLKNFLEKTGDQMLARSFETSNHTRHEIITMASIIEAEVPLDADRAIVSGIFWKRIDAGVPLQADSTVNYATGKSARAASLTDLKFNSPYNTYLYPDLPPGPIGNPGVSAIKAALSPQESDYWFFLSREDGTTVFSKTLDEHAAAKERYIKP